MRTLPTDPWRQSELARLSFLGSAGRVTGACFLLQTRHSRVLIECGMFQGPSDERRLNTREWLFDPAGIDAVVVTHAHIDHTGLLPSLVRDGFSGPVHATRATRDLSALLLRDAAHLQEQWAERQNRKRLRRGLSPVEPLYDSEDADRAIHCFRPRAFDRRFQVTEDVRVRFLRAGHILGAAVVEVWIRDRAHDRKLVFSGDLGTCDSALHRGPTIAREADLVVMESTYGARNHKSRESTMEEFAEILDHAAAAGEKVLIPVFSVGRAQEILLALADLERQGRLRDPRVYLDSPMAIDATKIYRRYVDDLRPEIQRRFEREERPFSPRGLVFVNDWQDSMALNWMRGGVVLAAGGMCDGGRIVHHLKHNLWRQGVHVVFVGFQGRGTLGRALVDGATRARVLGEEVVVKAKIHTLGGFSAHADQRGLVSWLGSFQEPRPATALIHGEPEERTALAELARTRLGVESLLPEQDSWLEVPRSGARFELHGTRAKVAGTG